MLSHDCTCCAIVSAPVAARWHAFVYTLFPWLQENPPEDEAQVVEKILASRLGKRPVTKYKEETKSIVSRYRALWNGSLWSFNYVSNDIAL